MAQLKVINGGLHPFPGKIKTITLQKHIPPPALIDGLIKNLKAVCSSDYEDLKILVYGALTAGGYEVERRRLNYERK